MTDQRNAQPGSYGTSGYGAETGEETPMAPDSGKASVRSHRPGAASPAGWFPPPPGEAAPPVRHREPARSDELSGPAGSSEYTGSSGPSESSGSSGYMGYSGHTGPR